MSRDENYYNPNGTVPAPAGVNMPKALWSTELMNVPWVGVVGTTDTAIWKTPTFDMRPDLRSAQSMVKAGVPIWNPTSRLYLQIFGLTLVNTNMDTLRLGYREFGNTTWGQVTQAAPNRAVANSGVPNQVARDPVVQVSSFVDITNQLMLGTNQPPSVIIPFTPIGEGYPVRYWALEVIWISIESTAGPAGANSLSFQAAMY